MEESAQGNIFTELLNRFVKPWRKWSFVLYFVLIILLFGGMGVIVSIVDGIKSKTIEGIVSNIMTYSLALLVPACITIILQLFISAKNKVSLVIISFVGVSIISLVAWTHNIYVAVGCIVLAWFFWVVANSDNVFLDDKAFEEKIKKEMGQHGKDWD